jgi:molybdopterin-guanine dinucleotide biosynthesis protein A
MGGIDKGLIEIDGVSLIERILERLVPQVEVTVINAGRNLDRYQSFGVAVVEDLLIGQPGPLAGMHAALDRLGSRVDQVLFVPCDAPDILPDLAARMRRTLDAYPISRSSYARAGGKSHPTFCLLPVSLKHDIEKFLEAGHRRVESFLKSVDAIAVDFDDQVAHFANLNSQQDLAQYLRQRHLHEP